MGLLCERRASLARPSPHRTRHRGPDGLSHLLASPQTAAQGRGQSREEGAGPVAAGQHMGEGLQSNPGQQRHQTDEENLSEDRMRRRLFSPT